MSSIVNAGMMMVMRRKFPRLLEGGKGKGGFLFVGGRRYVTDVVMVQGGWDLKRKAAQHNIAQDNTKHTADDSLGLP